MTWISAGKILMYSSVVAKDFLSVIGLSPSLPVHSASQLDCLPGDSYHPNASLDEYSMLKRKKLLASCHLVLMPSVQEPKVFGTHLASERLPPFSFTEDFVCPFYQSNQGSRSGEAGMFVGQIGFKDPTGPRTRRSNMDVDAQFNGFR
jgi:hypothetical protein